MGLGGSPRYSFHPAATGPRPRPIDGKLAIYWIWPWRKSLSLEEVERRLLHRPRCHRRDDGGRRLEAPLCPSILSGARLRLFRGGAGTSSSGEAACPRRRDYRQSCRSALKRSSLQETGRVRFGDI